MGRVELLQGKPLLLGKHPAFAEFRRRSELLKLPVKELVRRLRQVENNIWRVKSELAKGINHIWMRFAVKGWPAMRRS